MLLETIGFAVIGIAVAFGATRALADRLPSPLLVSGTGACAALLGGWVARTVFGAGHAPITFALAAAVSVALVTLLIKPKGRARPPAGAGPARA
ncbi:hypothetical protein [Wenjunlia tyrosinilytica]|uniref:Uncharacterized protein n=1 Tax=Wenjunlia tyrosinilytica TaxID=1544741 RepID=A0A918DWK3_9ACTN|nr:hypothetical protein [Wenjunlia tyrosinilytica]GGO85841.1 hypothetical protein GCM10012280_20560 [Wenjunlia tyrosinilytica]